MPEKLEQKIKDSLNDKNVSFGLSGFKDIQDEDDTVQEDDKFDIKNLSDGESKEEEKSPFERELDILNVTKDDIMDMIVEVTDNGFIAERGEIFGGRVSYLFKSGSISDYGDFIMFFENLNAKVKTTVDYYYNLHTLATFLVEYNGKHTGDSIEERVKYIEDNIPTPIFDTLVISSFTFGRKVALLSTKEVADFF